ncbi:hypothetical protein VP01_2969g1 [Puccinia sorghi]|uniref:Uncharacterized protein n=1 Tax=Puccinia sorghi TaxID=27349 RepID=A0A0L6V0U5_9BASI|nr:hypothetical protein VP01_2969g1 [Puccinia sorghi]
MVIGLPPGVEVGGHIPRGTLIRHWTLLHSASADKMFPMLGPPRPKKKNKKTVRVIEPQPNEEKEQKEKQGSIASNQAIYQPTISSSLSSDKLPTISLQTLIVISFITRFPLKKNKGQGSVILLPHKHNPKLTKTKPPSVSFIRSEILFFKPKTTLTPSESHHCALKWSAPSLHHKKHGTHHLPSKTINSVPKNTQGTASKWTFLFIDGGPLEEYTSDQLSLRSIKRHLSPPDDRLVKVRSSKPLKWDPRTTLVSVIYRLQEIDRKKDEEWIKIDVESHYWSKIYGFHSAIENNLVSTALAAVSFPIAFNVGFEEIAQQDPHTRSDIVTLKALETLYLSVQAGYARDVSNLSHAEGFKFYPQTAEPLKKVGNSDRDFKRRIWAYWTEVGVVLFSILFEKVLCWHLISCRSAYKVSISYALNKILATLRPEVRNDKVNVEDLEKRMVDAIGIEADRCRQSVENIVKHAVFEILHAPDHLSHNDSITSIQIFTLGSSSATHEALSQLGMSRFSDPGVPVKHFITQSRWKPGLAHEKSIEGLKITIAENRPLHEGVILANKLNELIDVYQAPRPAPPKLNLLKQASSIGSLNKLLESKDWYLNAQHQKFLESLEDHHVPLNGLFSHTPAIGHDGDENGHLGDLLER